MHTDPVAITVETPVTATYRTQAVAGMFDLAIAPTAKAEFRAELPQFGEDWQTSLIVGPSGAGKSTIAKHA
jgi:putative ribosome biogenesis GTPase RsgA